MRRSLPPAHEAPTPKELFLQTPCKPKCSGTHTRDTFPEPFAALLPPPAPQSDTTLEDEREEGRGRRPRRPALTSAKKLSMVAPRPVRECTAPGPSRAPCAATAARPGSATPSRLNRRAAPSRPTAGTSPQPLSARPLRAARPGGPGSS